MATEKRLIDAYAFYKKFVNDTPTITMGEQRYVATWRISDLIADSPTVDAVEVVHGRWILMVHEKQCNFRWNVTAECSECQHSKGEIYAGHFSGFPKDLVESMLPLYAKRVKLDNYCPNCGAKMDGDGNV